MTRTNKKYIKYPFEYFAAQIEFGVRIAQIKKISKIKAFKKYTDIYGAITNHTFADNKKNKWIKKVLSEFESLTKTTRDIDTLSFKTYKLFLNTPFAMTKLDLPKAKDKLRFGCFRLNNSSYYTSRHLVRLHFSPTRIGLTAKDQEQKTSDLAPIYMPARKEEFSNMINYIYDNPKKFKGVTHFMSSTWLQSLPAYQSFFPESLDLYKSRLDNIYMWLWGQFIKWDFSGNEKRLAEFKQKVRSAQTMKEVVHAIPYHVYEVKIPIEEMFAKYVEDYQAETGQADNAVDVILPLQFGTNHPARKHIAYQLEE